MTTYLIRGGRPYGEDVADVLVRDGVVAAIGPDAAVGADEAVVVDADGCVVLPGLVDLHTHLREPGREDAETIETGTRAAALGGFTAVHAMANTSPVADTAGVVEQVWRIGRDSGWVDVHPVGAVSVDIWASRRSTEGPEATSREPCRKPGPSGRGRTSRWLGSRRRAG